MAYLRASAGGEGEDPALVTPAHSGSDLTSCRGPPEGALETLSAWT